MANTAISKVALITGAACGIGKAIAETLAAQNITVVISDINTEKGAEVAAALKGLFVEADLSSAEGCRTLVDQATQHFGRVDILINNVGVQHISPIADFPEKKWAAMIQLMLVSPFILTKLVWPLMAQQGGGRIINMGSIHSHVASLNKSAYVSAKHGLIGLTKSTALEGAAHGITANAVCPAYVKTPLVESQIADQAKTLGIPEAAVIEQVMLEPAAIKRLIDPAEVAELVAYLCSEKASAITGSAFDIDLGWVAR